MGTACITVVFEGDSKKLPLVAMESSSDGYPEGMGADLIKFMSNRVLVNGISVRQRADGKTECNGSGDFAAQLVAHFKATAPVGGYYLVPYHRGLLEEYNYVYEIHVYPDKDYAQLVMFGAKSWKSN